MTPAKLPILEKMFRLETPDRTVSVPFVYEQQVRSLRAIFPDLDVVETRSDVDFGRTAQRDREDQEEQRRLEDRMASRTRSE